MANYYWDSFAGYLLIQIRKSTDGGINFYTKNLDYSGHGGFDIDSDSLGNIYIVWQPKWGPPRCTKFVEGDLNNTVETIIPDITFETKDYGIAVLKENIFITLSARLDPDLYIFKTFLTKSFDRGLTFSSPQKLDTSITDSTNQEWPRIYSGDERLSISWIDNRNGNNSVYYCESNDNGHSFTDVIKVSTNDDRNAGFPGITGNRSMLGLAWCALLPTHADIFFCYRSSPGGAFSASEKVGNPLYLNYNQYLADISADKGGYIYILFCDDRYWIPENFRLYLSIAKFEISNIEREQTVSSSSLLQNHPNPYNGLTQIDYELTTETFVNITVFSITGEKIDDLVNENKSQGIYSTYFNSDGLSSGVYFYRLKTKDNVIYKKMIILR